MGQLGALRFGSAIGAVEVTAVGNGYAQIAKLSFVSVK
jgi:hypothetical protein